MEGTARTWSEQSGRVRGGVIRRTIRISFIRSRLACGFVLGSGLVERTCQPLARPVSEHRFHLPGGNAALSCGHSRRPCNRVDRSGESFLTELSCRSNQPVIWPLSPLCSVACPVPHQDSRESSPAGANAVFASDTPAGPVMGSRMVKRAAAGLDWRRRRRRTANISDQLATKQYPTLRTVLIKSGLSFERSRPTQTSTTLLPGSNE
jgi:hypothetical protein